MLILMRFMNKEYVSDFLKGKIYMRSNGYFIDLEKESKIKGIGDKYEGAYLEYFKPEYSEVFLITENGEKFPVKFKQMEVAENFENIKKFPILCSTLLDFEDFDVIDQKTLKIKDEVLQDLKTDFKNKSCIIIGDFFEFKKRIEDELNRLGLRGTMGPIHYFNTEHPLSREEFEKNPREALFYKRDYYEYQREYRLVVEQIDKDEITLEIGDISNFVTVLDADDLDKIQIMKK